MSEQTLAEYAIQKIASDNMQELREATFKAARVAINVGLPLEAALLATMAGTGNNKAVNFMLECWIREAYEKAGKEK